MMAWLALEAGDTERATGWAHEVARIPEVLAQLPRDPGPLDPWPHRIGNVVLGRIALDRGDLDEAERRLELAGRHPPGALLSRFPDFVLAHEMLERHRTQPVLSYLEACRDMWIIGEEQIDGWLADISRGHRPDLDASSTRMSLQLRMKVLRRLFADFRALPAQFKQARRNR